MVSYWDSKLRKDLEKRDKNIKKYNERFTEVFKEEPGEFAKKSSRVSRSRSSGGSSKEAESKRIEAERQAQLKAEAKLLAEVKLKEQSRLAEERERKIAYERAEQQRKVEMEKSRVINSLKRVERGEIEAFEFQTNQGKIKADNPEKAMMILKALEQKESVEESTRQQQAEQQVQERTYENPFVAREQKFKSAGSGAEFVVGTKQPESIWTDAVETATNKDLQPQIKIDLKVPGQNQIRINTERIYNPNVPRKETKGFVPGIPSEALLKKLYIQPPNLSEKLREKSFTEQTKKSFGGVGKGLVAGSLSSIGGTIAFGKGIVTQPVETVGQTIQAVTFDLPKNIKTFGETIQNEPAFATGFIASEIVQFKAIGGLQKGALKLSDVYRTRGLTELPVKEVIAPEYFRGQKFPSIRKGQTAKNLLKEFQPKLPGEKKQAGYTASPQPFKELQVRAGTSEIPGLYQAPELSPHFLKLTDAEKKLFTFNFLGDTARPSIFRITPEKIELPKGVTSGQKNLASLKQIQQFYRKNAELGRSYVPFVKTEKEAVLTAGTELSQINKRFYIKFEGRRIPIFEYETVRAGKQKTPIVTTEDLKTSLSSSRIGKKGLISSPDIIKASSSLSNVYSNVNKISLSSGFLSTKSSSGFLGRKSSYNTPTLSSALYPLSRSSKSISRQAPTLSSVLSKVKTNYNILSSSRAYPPYSSKPVLPKFPTSPFFLNLKSVNKPINLYSVYQRRYGKFKPIGSGLSLLKAINRGVNVTSRNLGATFKVKGKNLNRLKTPTGYYKKYSKKEGLLFIEKPKYRLSTTSEVVEIQTTKRRKRK